MTETTPPPVHVAWSNAMGDLTHISKEGKAPAAFGGYAFRGIDDVMNAVGPVLRAHGLFVLPTVRESKHRDFLSDKSKTNHEAIVTVDYTIYGPAGDTMTGAAVGEAADTSDKATAQAMSVAYRIFLLQSMTMPTGDVDPDMNHVDRAPMDQQQAPPPAAPKPEFTAEQAAGAFADLHGQMAEVDEPVFSQLVQWVESENLGPETITRAKAAAWYEKIAAAPKRKVAAPPPATAAARGAGWGSEAERTATWKSLSERHDHALATFTGIGTPEHVDKPDEATFTKAQAEDWQAAIVGIEFGSEPF